MLANPDPDAVLMLRVKRGDLRMVVWVCVTLTAMVWVVFGQTLRHEFVNYDDNECVYENLVVTQGLSAGSVGWAFTHSEAGNWIPLTTLSHILDCQIFGINAGGHHLTSLLLHTAAAILLFLVLRQMTGSLWRSALVAAVFAVHPLRVESVAWIAERKDVLSGVFFMLTIAAYVRYTRGPWSPGRYGLVVFLFALGLMCKPMLVTLPFVLLILDYWPLKRFEPSTRSFQPPTFSRLVLEKLPLLGLAAASCVATLFAQTGAMSSLDQISFPSRVGNALIACVTYLGQMFWPSGLAVFYPFPTNGGPAWEKALAAVLLLSITTGVFVLRKTRPYLLAGWLWYLVMLVPVIGILQVGSQARADRYTYLPQIGLYLMLTWAVADLCARCRQRRWVLGGCSVISLTALMLCARTQAAYWRNSETLWTHTLACTSDNYIAQNNLGNALLQKGSLEESIVHFQQSLQIQPDYAEAWNNLGNALLRKGKLGEAMACYQKALQLRPVFLEAQNNLGNALLQKGDVKEALGHFQQALLINPDYEPVQYNLGFALLLSGNVDEATGHFWRALQLNPADAEARNNLGNALLQKGSVAEAINHFQQAAQLKPDDEQIHYNLGNALLQSGRTGDAIIHYQKALQIKPDYAKAQNNLAWVLATAPQAALRNGNQAVELAKRANQLTGGDDPAVLHTLAAACAEAGRFPEAVQTAQRALQLARQQSNPVLADALQSELKLYQAGRPFHFD
jgi:protein O-mannosyl-transferase